MSEQTFVVAFAGCEELVLRTGESPESVMQPDGLGCPAISARPLEPDEIKAIWRKNGEWRVELRDTQP